MMKFELGLERPDPKRTWISALTIGGSYLAGGIIPLVPYAFIPSAKAALYVSAGVTIFALFVFGYCKAVVLGVPRRFVSALQMTFTGALAAAAAFFIAQAIPQKY